jgi:hypothetical protein
MGMRRPRPDPRPSFLFLPSATDTSFQVRNYPKRVQNLARKTGPMHLGARGLSANRKSWRWIRR